ncbi:hypothetical protein [Veillonella sp.]|uniref:hypothetical protein n=1 Tax=Veillonella sp. TaxID=1926307 RepID=UPI0025CE86EC|nr:hypothetical protein [Veillonella sp.]
MEAKELEAIIQTITDKIWSQYMLHEKGKSLSQTATESQTSMTMHTMLSSNATIDLVSSNSHDLVVEELTLGEMSEIAYLMPRTDKSKQIVQCILEGRPIYVKERPKIPTHLKKIPYALKHQWQTIVNTCESYGIQFVTANYSGLSAQECNESKNENNKRNSKATFITVAKLVQLQQKGAKLPVGARLTPLARDYMREHNLKL